MRLLLSIPPESVRDLVLIVLIIAFLARIFLVYGSLRKLARSIDDDIDKRGLLANLNNVSELFLRPSIKQLGRAFIGWEILTLIAPMAIAMPMIVIFRAIPRHLIHFQGQPILSSQRCLWFGWRVTYVDLRSYESSSNELTSN